MDGSYGTFGVDRKHSVDEVRRGALVIEILRLLRIG